MTNHPESSPEPTPQSPDAEPAKTAEPTPGQAQEPGPTAIPDAEITHNRVGPHPTPEITDQEVIGRIADAFWGVIGPQIMNDAKRKKPREGGL